MSTAIAIFGTLLFVSIIRHNFPDYHIKGFKNWWEDIITGNKKKERSDAKKQIQSEIIEEE